MKLRTKFAVVLLFVAVVLSTGIYAGFEFYERQLVSTTQASVDETATLTAEQIDADVEEQRDFVGFTASRPVMARFNESDRALGAFVGNSRFFAAQLVAANGTVVDVHGDVTQDARREAVGSDVGDRPYVERALAGEVYVTDVQYVNATDRYVLIFSAPIIRDDDVKGVLAAAIYVDQRTFLSSIGPLETSDRAVAVSTGTGRLHEPRTTFDQALSATATVPSTGWTVTVVRDRSGLVTRLQWLAIAQGISLFLVFAAVVSFGVWEYRTTLSQTERLLAGFEALQRGEYDYSLSLAAADEWERIGEGFNDLAAALAAREAELREHEQRLQVFNRVLRHNLRNDMNIILSEAEFLAEEATDERQRVATHRLHETAEELLALGEKARQIEKAMDRSETVGPTRIDLTGVVSSVLADLRERYPEADVTASLPEEAWVSAVPAIDLAVENVLENACKHDGGDDQHVAVDVDATDRGTVTLTVADTGPGLPSLERNVLEAGRETPLEHGQGLGLWLTYWTVERSDGDVWFEENDPTGTVVGIELQRADPTETD